MHIKLDVLASCNIKRKKPWPRLVWLGKEKESLFLMDNHRLSVLYVPSGKTKRKVPKVHPHLENVVVMSSSPNGEFLIGLQHTGNLFLWHKDKDRVKTITGLPDLATHILPKALKENKEREPPRPNIFLSNDGCKLIVIIGNSRLFLWEIDRASSLYSNTPKQNELKGTWSHIATESSIMVPTQQTKETVVDAKFFIDSVLGYCCVCSFVFNVDDKIQVTSVVLRWLEQVDIKSVGNPSFTVEWSSFRTPTAQIVSGCRPVRARGAYRIAHSHDGLTLAVAANQRSPHNNRVIFISLLTSTAQVSDLKGCGTKAPNPPPNLARSFWVTDMKWTCDDLFIVCMTKRGSLAIMTRLGEPVRLESQGCSVELGPDMYLPFHPLISYTSKKEQHEKIQQQHQPQSPTSSMMSEVDIMKQKFSVSTHPSLPLLLCSDGYLVTVIQLPEDSSCANLMKTFLAEARLKLNKISEQHNIHTALLPTIKFDQTDSLPKRRVQINYQFEQAGDTMGLSTGSSMSPSEFLGLNDLDEGKLMFGDGMDEFNRTGGSRGETPDFDTTKHLQAVQTSLQAAWGLGISYTGIWTTQLDKIMVITVDSMIKLCELLLKTAPDSKVSKIEQDDGLLQRIFKLFATSPDMYRILMLLRHALSVLGWDTVHQNSSSYTLRLVTGLCQTLLQTDTRQSYFKTLACCYHILLYSEKAINNAYSWLPKAMNIDSSASEFEFHLSDNVEGTVLCRQLTRRRASLRAFDYEGSLSARSQRGSMSARSLRDSVREAREEIDQLKIVEESVVSLKHTPAKRLMLSWKSLYRQLLRYHSKLSHRLTKASDITDSMDNKIVVKQQKVILLLCATQVKLHDLGFDIVEDRTWKRNLNRVFLKGAMHYEAGHLSQAIETWRDIAEEISMAENPSLTSYPLLETQSLLAVLYTQLQQSNLMGALQLVDSLIDCYSELPGLGGSRSFKQQLKLCKSDASFMSVFTNMLGPQEAAPILPCVNRTSIKPVVESLSRFMALYFSNRSLYIYPPHAAAPLKPLYNKDIVHACRVIPLYHEDVSFSIRQQDLSEIWTSDRALQLLLVAGLLPEAIWFAKELGDWKSAFVLGVTYIKYKDQHLDKEDIGFDVSADLPEDLHPLTIMQSSLEYLVEAAVPGMPFKIDEESGTLRPPSSPVGLKRSPSAASLASMGSFNVDEEANVEQVSKTITDMLTAAAISGLDATPWLLTKIIDRCKSLVSQLNGLVPDGLYLPAPPLYCPQPATASAARIRACENDGVSRKDKIYHMKTEETEEVIQERQLRHDIANTIQLFLLVLTSANCTLSCTKWYVEQLVDLQDTLIAATGDEEEVSFVIDIPKSLIDHVDLGVDLIQDMKAPPPVAQTLTCFRDLCTLVWLLHVRDKFSACARKYQSSREKSVQFKPHDTIEFSEILHLLLDTLKWGLCLLPFTHYLDMESGIQDMVLTLLSELPTTKNTANILAEYFYHPDVVSPAVEEKFQRCMEIMKTVHVPQSRYGTSDSDDARPISPGKNKRKLPPQPKPLADYFQERCKEKQSDLETRSQRHGTLEMQVFSTVSETSKPKLPVVGAREFESSELFLEFLDTFFLVSFNKLTSASESSVDLKVNLPLLAPFSEAIKEQELTSISHKVIKSIHQRHGISLQSPSLSRSQSYQEISPRTKLDFIEIRKMKDHGNKSPSPRRRGGLFRSYSFSESLVQKSKPVIQVVHKRYGSQGSIPTPEKEAVISRSQSESGADGQRVGFTPRRYPSSDSLPGEVIKLGRRSSSMTDVASLGSDIFVNAGLSHGFSPYANINVKLDPKYDDVTQLMEWLTRWSGKHHIISQRKQSLTQGAGLPFGQPAMRVNLPLQLVHNCLWLNDNKYAHPEQGDEDPDKTIEKSPVFLYNVTEEELLTGEDTSPKESKQKKGRKEKKKEKKEKKKKKKSKRAKSVQIEDRDEEEVQVERWHTTQRLRRQLDYSIPERSESPYQGRSPAPSNLTEDMTAVSPLPSIMSPFAERTDQMVTPDEGSRATPLFSEPLDSQMEPLKVTFEIQENQKERDGAVQRLASVEDEFSSSTTSLSGVSSYTEEEAKSDTERDAAAQVDMRSQETSASQNGSPKNLKKMIRVELKKIMEYQHQNILNFLDRSGTVNLEEHSVDLDDLMQQAERDNDNRPVRDRSRNRHPSRESERSMHSIDTQVSPSQSHVDTQTGQTLKLLGENQVPVTVYGSHQMEPTHDVPPYMHGTTYSADSSHTVPRLCLSDISGDGPLSQRAYHEPVLDHGMPLLRLPPEAQAHLRMPRARPFLARDAWKPHTDEHQESVTGKEFFSRPELKRFEDEMKSRQEMVKYLTEYGQVKGNVHGKKFFSVAEESEKTHKREHSKDIESKFEVKRKEDSTIPRERGFVHAMPLLRLEPGYAPSRLFDHYYSINDNRHVTNLPPVDASREAPHIHNKETPQADNVYTFPLLHLDKEASRPWVGGEMNGYHHGVPRLVPPEVIINYEQQKYHKEMSKFRGVYRENVKNAHMRDWQNRLAFGDQTGQSKGGYYPHPDEMGPIQLLHANIEPFEAEGDRHNITRRRRRRQKDKDGKTSKSKETESESRSESTRSQRTPRSKEHDVSDIDNNRGYVIPPGSYNCELRYKHDVSIYPTPAEIHLNAITHKDAKPRDHGVNQDVSTSMDTNGLDAAGKSVRFKEPDEVTSADAVNQYCEAATGLSSTGHVIAPEIFFGLRFGQAKEEQSSVDEGKDDQQSGRSYINVVDIDTSILNSIPEKEDQVTARPPAQPTSSVSPRADEMEPSIAELHYNAMRLKDGDSAIPSVSDRLTVQLLDGGMTADRVDNLPRVKPVMMSSKSQRDQAKVKMSEKLTEMNDQLNAIDTIARTMENEFKDTKLLLHTVEQMGEAIAPEGDRSRAASTPRQQGRPLRPADHDIDITTRPTKRDSDIELTPEDSLEIKKGKEDKRAAIGLPHQGNGEPSEREMRHVNENALHISGLSGVSDIIAEVIAEGDVDANEFGITEQQKLAAQQKILDRKEEKLWEYTRLSNDELRNIFHLPKQVDDTDPGFASVKPIRRSIEDREELQSWMSKRKEKQMAEYKQALLERRQAEREPYQPPKEDIFKPSSSLREIKKNEGSRRTVKRTTKDDDIQERVKDAYKLMGEILADKPDLPKEPIISTSRTHKSAVSTTTGKKDMGRGDPEKVTKARNLLYKEAVRVAGENKVRQPRRFDEHDRTLVRPDDYLHLRDSFEKDREYGQIPKSTYRIDESRQVRSYLPERSRDPVHRSFDSESTGITSAYARQLERQLSLDVDKSATLERIPESSENKENEPMKDKLIEEEYYEYKPKSYTQIVKIQRPHITRKQSQRTVKTYSERLADMKASSSRKHDSDSLRAKQRLYGTKRIPGSAKTVAAGPRVVKTYTERLADMRKQGEAQTRLLRPQRRPAKRPSVNTESMPVNEDRMSQLTARGIRTDTTPRSGATTYADRLKVLSNSGKYRGREGVVSPTPAVGVKYKDRSAKPSNYVERLQQATVKGTVAKHKTAYVGPPRTFLKSPAMRTPQSRSRPYVDPYRTVTVTDILDEVSDDISAMSGWSVPDDIRQILGKDDTTFTGASEMSGLSFSEMDYIDGDEYTSMVDIHELEDIASVGSGSIISDIDWSVIEKMVADVK